MFQSITNRKPARRKTAQTDSHPQLVASAEVLEPRQLLSSSPVINSVSGSILTIGGREWQTTLDANSPNSRLTYNPNDGSIDITQVDSGNAYITLEVAPNKNTEFSADFTIQSTMDGKMRGQCPGLFVFGEEKSQGVVFSSDGSRIQYIGSDNSNFGGIAWEIGKKYTMKMHIEYDRITLTYLDDQGNVLLSTVNPHTRDANYNGWHQSRTIRLGMSGQNDPETVGTERSFKIKNIQVSEEHSELTRASLVSRKVYYAGEALTTIRVDVESLDMTGRASDTITVKLSDSFTESFTNQSFEGFETKSYELQINPDSLAAGDYSISVIRTSSDGSSETVTTPIYIRPDPADPAIFNFLSWNEVEPEFLELANRNGVTLHSPWSGSYANFHSTGNLDLFGINNIAGGGFVGSTAGYYSQLLADAGVDPASSRAVYESGPSDDLNFLYQDFLDRTSTAIAAAYAPTADHPGNRYILLDTEKKDPRIPYNQDIIDALRQRGILGPDETMPGGWIYAKRNLLDFTHTDVIARLPQNGRIADDNVYFNIYNYWETEGGYSAIHAAASKAIHAINPEARIYAEFGIGGNNGADVLEFWYRASGDAENDVGHIYDLMASARRSAELYGHDISGTIQFLASGVPMNPDQYSIAQKYIYFLMNEGDNGGSWGMNRGLTDSAPAGSGELLAATKDLRNNFQDVLWPFVSQLEVPSRKFVFLQSQATVLFDQDRGSILNDWLRSEGWYKHMGRALTHAGVNYAVVSDTDIQNGVLKDVQGLFVTGTKVLREADYQKIRQFALSGGTVFADNDFVQIFNPDFNVQLVNVDPVDKIHSSSRWWATPHDDDIMFEWFPEAAENIRDALNSANLDTFAQSSSPHALTVTRAKDGSNYVGVFNALLDGSGSDAKGVAQTITLKLNATENVTIDNVLTGERLTYVRTDADHIEIRNFSLDAAEAAILAVHPDPVTDNHEPELEIGDRSFSHNDDALTITLSGNDPDGDDLTYTAMISGRDIDIAANNAYALDQLHDFQTIYCSEENNYWYDARGYKEKYLAGYFILPNAEVYRWGGSIDSSTLIGTLAAR